MYLMCEIIRARQSFRSVKRLPERKKDERQGKWIKDRAAGR